MSRAARSLASEDHLYRFMTDSHRHLDEVFGVRALWNELDRGLMSHRVAAV